MRGWGAGSGAGEGSVILCLLRALGQLWIGIPLFCLGIDLPSPPPPDPEGFGRRQGGRRNEDAPSWASSTLQLPSAGEWSLHSTKRGLDLIALLMEKPHFSIDLGFCSPWRRAGDSANGEGRGQESWQPRDRAGIFFLLITLPGAHIPWRGHSESGVLVPAPPLSVCVSSLLWA